MDANGSPRFEKIISAPPPKHEIVLDNTTGLIWPVEFSATRLTFAQAEKYVAELNAKKHCGFDDWRLPTRAELLTLVDDTRHAPAIDTDAFPGTPSEWFWTATPHAADPKNLAWIVHFDYGHSNLDYRYHYYHVRAVRGPSRQSFDSLERAA